MRIRLHSSRIGTALFVVLLVVGLTVPLFVAADSKEANEPNDVQEAATPIDGTSIDGELSKPGGTDWYSKEFSKGDTVSFAVTKPLWDQGLKVSLHAPDGTELDNNSAYHGVGKTELSVTASQSGEYALKVEPVNEEMKGMQYTIYAPASEAPTKEQPEIESGTQQENESNDNRAQAQPITQEEITGEFSNGNDDEWYSVPVKEGEKVSILITKEQDGGFYAEIYDPGSFYKRDSTIKSIEYSDTRTQVVMSAEQDGSINIKLVGSGGDYSLEYGIEITKTQQSGPDAGSENATANNTHTPPSTSSNTPAEKSDNQTETQSQNTNANTESSTDDDDQTSLFGPGFTGPGALVALFVTALFAFRRQGSA